MKKKHSSSSWRSQYSPIDRLKVQQATKKEIEKAQKESTERAFLYMLAIPLNVLVNNYWPKSAKDRAPKFIQDVIDLYQAVQQGVVTDDQLAELLEAVAGVKITADWLTKKD